MLKVKLKDIVENLQYNKAELFVAVFGTSVISVMVSGIMCKKPKEIIGFTALMTGMAAFFLCK